MAPLPVNNTARAWVRYTSTGREHNVMFRFPAGTTSTDATALLNTYIVALKAALPSNDAVIGARFALSGSNISLPLGVATGAGTNDAWTDPDQGASFVSFTGRSVDGRDVKFTTFVPGIQPDAMGYRLPSPGTWIADLRDVLDEMATHPRTISGQVPNMNPYANLGYNAYWQRQLRRGG